MRTALFSQLRSLFQRIPASILRWRPFDVYEIIIEDVPGQGRGGSLETPNRNEPAQETSQPLSIRWAATDDRERLEHLSPPVLLELLSRPRQAVIAEIDQRPVGVAWFARGVFDESELGLEFELAENEAWLFAAHVAPEFQRQGVYSKILTYAIDEQTKLGVQRLLLGVSKGNLASLKSHKKHGAKKIGSVLAARICSYLALAWTSHTIHASARLMFGRKPIIRLRIKK